MNKYKTFEELKRELGDNFEDFLYKSNIELLNKLDKIKEYALMVWDSNFTYSQDRISSRILELLEEIE